MLGVGISQREPDMNSTRTIIVALTCALGAISTSARAQDVSGATPEAATQAPAAQEPVAPAVEKKAEPFAFADFTWLTGNARTKDAPLDTKAFTGEFRADTNFTYSFN